ncbi:MAG: excinuclease ABC subunit UvrC, partial [Clostridia bacterium]|nr:excinuclease ABC subunit UvrC [Clostridia bacterium]
MTDKLDAPSRREILLREANDLPASPGVYIMKDRGGRVIYVGKSKKLRDRVSQYFIDSEKSVRTGRMVASVWSFDRILCDSEIEALALENNLIKKYSPRYNVKLKDAKSYPYIKVGGGSYPVLSMSRDRSDPDALYFGPYSGSATAFSVISTVNGVVGLPSCRHKFPEKIGKVRPCVYYQIGKCRGICKGGVSEEEYAGMISSACELLKGNTAALRRGLSEKMLEYSEKEMYEAAAGVRDSIAALRRLGENQKAVDDPDVFRDACAVASSGGVSALSLLIVREGRLTDKIDSVCSDGTGDVSGSAVSILSDYYSRSAGFPEELLLGDGFGEEERALLEGYLSSIAKKRVRVRIPERGNGKKLCVMAAENALEYAEKTGRELSVSDSTAEKLGELLGCEVLPERIEAFDISGFGNECLTAGMIVCERGRFVKKDYRLFRMKTVGTQNDFASMKEAVGRRLARLAEQDAEEDAFSRWPDLILVDGGSAQLEAAREAAREQGVDVFIAGMVKDGSHRTRALVTADGIVDISREQDVFSLIYRIQEEIHRFTVRAMTDSKRKTVRRSSLEK